jgi:hypothetical protein
MKDEIARRQSAVQLILELFRAQSGRWIHWRRFERFAPCAWRSRIADCRRIVQREGDDIVWNKRVHRSAYMLRPKPLTRDAAEVVTQKSLF